LFFASILKQFLFVPFLLSRDQLCAVMNSIMNVLRMAFSRGKSTESDLEQGRSEHRHPGFTPTGATEPQLPHIEIDHNARPEISPDDQLNLFRHLTGITSHPSMVHSHLEAGGRPAPNLGIYARVVHNEQDAKRGYKYFSWLINGCLGLQIVVAAALTAMGAAGASRSAVTVFGAINTVIAGILTFLKGSGLPNRLKYYQTEWKRVREFIEQRERDFSRPNCDLDIYGVVAIVENMYEEVKIDLEASTPDRFAGFSSARKTTQQAEPPSKSAAIPLPRTTTEALSEKFLESGFGGRVKDLASEIGHRAQQAKEVAKDLQTHKAHLTDDASREFKDYTERAERVEHGFADKVKDLASEIGHRAHQAQDEARHLQAQQQKEIEDAGKEARAYAQRVEHAASSRLGGPISINLSGTTAAPSRDP
jgi:hypothetical protein